MTLCGPEDRAFFRERYGRTRSEAARRVERLVLGHDVGLNGYTTVDQARRLRQSLDLSSASRLLDVGSGRGWPGVFLGWASECQVVLSDIPVAALRQAQQYAEGRSVSGLVRTVCADGRSLPFCSECFDAVVHADVLC